LGARTAPQGWARRFLVGLFQSYTVLFVGDGHEDVVMGYLARGLPPSDQGKALRSDF
jgi:hypothetical protein